MKIERVKDKLEVALDELGFADRTGDDSKREFYIRNSMRFIEDALEELNKNE